MSQILPPNMKSGGNVIVDDSIKKFSLYQSVYQCFEKIVGKIATELLDATQALPVFPSVHVMAMSLGPFILESKKSSFEISTFKLTLLAAYKNIFN